jgi:hypothetical protein
MTSVYLLVFSILFGTVAQVSFGLAGVLLVILTFDDERKKRWFESNNFLCVGVLFLMLVWPGLIAFLGLAPDASLTNLAIFACIFYASVTILWWIIARTRPSAEPGRWTWPGKIRGIKGDAILLAAGWGLVLVIPSYVGLVLILSLFLPTVAIFIYWTQRG